MTSWVVLECSVFSSNSKLWSGSCFGLKLELGEMCSAEGRIMCSLRLVVDSDITLEVESCCEPRTFLGSDRMFLQFSGVGLEPGSDTVLLLFSST